MREELALLYAMEEFNIDAGIILTEDHEKSVKQKGKFLEYVATWKWLLQI